MSPRRITSRILCFVCISYLSGCQTANPAAAPTSTALPPTPTPTATISPTKQPADTPTLEPTPTSTVLPAVDQPRYFTIAEIDKFRVEYSADPNKNAGAWLRKDFRWLQDDWKEIIVSDFLLRGSEFSRYHDYYKVLENICPPTESDFQEAEAHLGEAIHFPGYMPQDMELQCMLLTGQSVWLDYRRGDEMQVLIQEMAAGAPRPRVPFPGIPNGFVGEVPKGSVKAVGVGDVSGETSAGAWKLRMPLPSDGRCILPATPKATTLCVKPPIR